MTSAISSNVPVPPGKAIKASPSSIILFFRSDISLVTISLVKSFCLHSHRCFQRNRSNPVLVFHAGMVGKAPGIPLFRIQIVGSVEKLQEFFYLGNRRRQRWRNIPYLHKYSLRPSGALPSPAFPGKKNPSSRFFRQYTLHAVHPEVL